VVVVVEEVQRALILDPGEVGSTVFAKCGDQSSSENRR
jgi:hypothetical protein